MMTDVLAAELASDFIRVNAIVPGFVKTKFSQVLWENDSLHAQTLQLIPQRRMAEPEELGPLAVYSRARLTVHDRRAPPHRRRPARRHAGDVGRR